MTKIIKNNIFNMLDCGENKALLIYLNQAC